MRWPRPCRCYLWEVKRAISLHTPDISEYHVRCFQVVYHDISGRWSFGIYIADTERVKCLATEQLGDLAQYDQHSHGVYQQCYTSQVMHIKKNQSVTIRCLYGSRRILTKPEFTFWGIVRLWSPTLSVAIFN